MFIIVGHFVVKYAQTASFPLAAVLLAPLRTAWVCFFAAFACLRAASQRYCCLKANVARKQSTMTMIKMITIVVFSCIADIRA